MVSAMLLSRFRSLKYGTYSQMYGHKFMTL